MGDCRARRRRPMGFFGPFNKWWSDFFHQNGRRPSKADIEAWRRENPDWRPELTVEDIVHHSKGRRDPEKNRLYFVEYRRKVKAAEKTASKRTSSDQRASAKKRRRTEASTRWEEEDSDMEDDDVPYEIPTANERAAQPRSPSEGLQHQDVQQGQGLEAGLDSSRSAMELMDAPSVLPERVLASGTLPGELVVAPSATSQAVLPGFACPNSGFPYGAAGGGLQMVTSFSVPAAVLELGPSGANETPSPCMPTTIPVCKSRGPRLLSMLRPRLASGWPLVSRGADQPTSSEQQPSFEGCGTDYPLRSRSESGEGAGLSSAPAAGSAPFGQQDVAHGNWQSAGPQPDSSSERCGVDFLCTRSTELHAKQDLGWDRCPHTGVHDGTLKVPVWPTASSEDARSPLPTWPMAWLSAPAPQELYLPPACGQVQQPHPAVQGYRPEPSAVSICSGKGFPITVPAPFYTLPCGRVLLQACSTSSVCGMLARRSNASHANFGIHTGSPPLLPALRLQTFPRLSPLAAAVPSPLIVTAEHSHHGGVTSDVDAGVGSGSRSGSPSASESDGTCSSGAHAAPLKLQWVCPPMGSAQIATMHPEGLRALLPDAEAISLLPCSPAEVADGLYGAALDTEGCPLYDADMAVDALDPDWLDTLLVDPVAELHRQPQRDASAGCPWSHAAKPQDGALQQRDPHSEAWVHVTGAGAEADAFCFVGWSVV